MLLVILSFIWGAWSSWDSVAVFHRPEKVVILVHEDGAGNEGNNRLRGFMKLLGDRDSLTVHSSDGSLKIQCGKDRSRARCQFRVLPGEGTVIGDKMVTAQGALDAKLNETVRFEAYFLNSNGDEFFLSLNGDQFFLKGSKR